MLLLYNELGKFAILEDLNIGHVSYLTNSIDHMHTGNRMKRLY